MFEIHKKYDAPAIEVVVFVNSIICSSPGAGEVEGFSYEDWVSGNNTDSTN